MQWTLLSKCQCHYTSLDCNASPGSSLAIIVSDTAAIMIGMMRSGIRPFQCIRSALSNAEVLQIANLSRSPVVARKRWASSRATAASSGWKVVEYRVADSYSRDVDDGKDAYNG